MGKWREKEGQDIDNNEISVWQQETFKSKCWKG